MDKKEATKLIENYIFWRDIKIPALEAKIKYAGLSCTPSYTPMIRSGDIGDKVGSAAEKIDDAQRELDLLKSMLETLDGISLYLGKDYQLIFEMMKEPKKYSWIEMAGKAEVTEKEFRNRRERILNCVWQTFYEITLPFGIYKNDGQSKGNLGA